MPHADRDLSLAEHLETFRENSMFRHNFAAARPAVDKRDMRALSENFEKILRGETVVK